MSPPRVRRPAQPHWHIVDSPVPHGWNVDRVLHLIFNPNTLTTTTGDLRTAELVLDSIVADGDANPFLALQSTGGGPAATVQGVPGVTEAVITLLAHNGSRALLIATETTRTTKRRLYSGYLTLDWLVIAHRLLGMRQTIGWDYATGEVDPDTRQALSIVCCDPPEPSPDVRGAARDAMTELGEQSLNILAGIVCRPAEWDPRYEHANPDSDGWREILTWCTTTFPTRAHTAPWIATSLDVLVAVDYARHGFTPESAAPWLPAFSLDAHTASAWAHAGVDPAEAASWAAFTAEHRDFDSNPSQNRDRHWGTLTEQVRLQQLGLPPDVYVQFEDLTPQDIASWLGEFGPDRAVAYVRAGYSWEEATMLDADPSTRPTLATLTVEGTLHANQTPPR